MKKIVILSLVVILVLCNLLFGSVSVSFLDWNILTSNERDVLLSLLYESRLPRTVLALSAGVLCSLVGLVLQTTFRNFLAGPTTLGINSGASLGVALYFYLLSVAGYVPVFVGSYLFSALGAVLFLTLIVWTAKRFKTVSTILIVGILLGYVAFAIIEILIQSSSENAISNYVFWGMGSFNGASTVNVVVITLLGVFCYVYFYMRSNVLNLYLLGDDELKMNKYSPSKIRVSVIVIAGVVIGVLTSIVGPLAFLGIAIPNFLKLILKTLDHRLLIPFCAILGGGFTVLADLLSRGAVFTSIFPLNAVLSIMAIPIIVVLLLNRNNGSST